MDFLQSLRLDQTPTNPVICFVGSGGKTTALFQLARQLINRRSSIKDHKSIIITATSHLGIWQTSFADHHIIAGKSDKMELPSEGVILVTGEIDGDRTKPVNSNTLNWLHAKTETDEIPLLIEADGSRQKPLKGWAEHEPPIPDFVDHVITVVGLSGLGKSLTEEHVHRPEIFAELSGLKAGEIIDSNAVTHVLDHAVRLG